MLFFLDQIIFFFSTTSPLEHSKQEMHFSRWVGRDGQGYCFCNHAIITEARGRSAGYALQTCRAKTLSITSIDSPSARKCFCV